MRKTFAGLMIVGLAACGGDSVTEPSPTVTVEAEAETTHAPAPGAPTRGETDRTQDETPLGS